MFDKDSWQEIFSTIRKNKLRTSLTMLGVFWGIFMLVFMLGAGNGMRNGIMKVYANYSTNSVYFWAQKTSKTYQGFKPGRSFNFHNEDIYALESLKDLTISPSNQLGNYRGLNKAMRGIKTGSFQVVGNYPNAAAFSRLEIQSGRWINENDMKEFRKVCVIGKRVQEVLFSSKENPIGKYIQVGGIYFMVIGLTKPNQGGERGEEESTKIILPFTSFQKAFNYGNLVGFLSILAKPTIKAQDAEEMVLKKLKERFKIAPDDKVAIGHYNLGTEYEKLNGLFSGINFLVWIIGIGTLLAGIIGISNIMLIVVKERTREIGVKRALGATPANIISQIMLEALFLTSIAGYLGLIVGIYVLEALNKAIGQSPGSTFSNPTVDLFTAFYSLLAIIIGGLFAGLIPAQKAVAISPVEALRAE